MPSSIIVALDFENRAEAISLVQVLGSAADSYKIGLQLLTSEGPTLVRDLVEMGEEVFLDLKLHEIPNSVAGAVTAAGKLGVSMVSVHASAGTAVLCAAVEAAAQFPQLKVVALTVITSLSDADLPELGLAASVDQQVDRLARLAVLSGCHGVIASVREAKSLAHHLPTGFLIVTPSIQSQDATTNDQSRIATPAAAAAAGATHIVIGRAITRAAKPAGAYRDAVISFHKLR